MRVNMSLKLEEDADWIYKPILHTNTRTTYDSDGIQQDIIDEYEFFDKDD